MLLLKNQRLSVFYYPLNDSLLSPDFLDEGEEVLLECYRSAFSLLCLIFRKFSPAAYEISLGNYAAERLRHIAEDPYVGISSTEFSESALSLAGFCLRDEYPKGKLRIVDKIAELSENLAAQYSHLKITMEEDADYAHDRTFPLIPGAKRSDYVSLLADFEVGMKTILVEEADETLKIVEKIEIEEDNISLYAPAESSMENYSISGLRAYLKASPSPDIMSLEAFDALVETCRNFKPKKAEVWITPLKQLVSARVEGKLSDIVQHTGEFPVTDELIIALSKCGEVKKSRTRDYGDLEFRLSGTDHWFTTNVKFTGGGGDEAWDEFAAFMRIAKRGQ